VLVETLNPAQSINQSINLVRSSAVTWLSSNVLQVSLRRARLVLQWVTASGRANHLGMAKASRRQQADSSSKSVISVWGLVTV